MKLPGFNTYKSKLNTSSKARSTKSSQSPDMISQIAYVISDIQPDKPGRLRYQATEWNALSMDNSFIPKGSKVRPVMRRGNTWYVAKNSDSPAQMAA